MGIWTQRHYCHGLQTSLHLAASWNWAPPHEVVLQHLLSGRYLRAFRGCSGTGFLGQCLEPMWDLGLQPLDFTEKLGSRVASFTGSLANCQGCFRLRWDGQLLCETNPCLASSLNALTPYPLSWQHEKVPAKSTKISLTSAQNCCSTLHSTVLVF